MSRPAAPDGPPGHGGERRMRESGKDRQMKNSTERGAKRDVVQEKARQVPVVRDVDVVVVGSGVSGLFAALGSAKQGARTLLIDRFGQLGGNMGPGGFIASTFGPTPGKTHHVVDYPGVCREFVVRLEAKLNPVLHPSEAAAQAKQADTTSDDFEYPSFSSAVSWLAMEMAEELGVELMLSAYAADSIVADGVVRGLFVETKSGRVAVRSKVLIDATGDASIAERAGVEVRHESASPERGRTISSCECWLRSDFPTWNEGGIAIVVAGVDRDRYDAFRTKTVELNDADVLFREELGSYHPGDWFPAAMIPLLREAQESGRFQVRRALPGNSYVTAFGRIWLLEGGLSQMVVEAGGGFDLGNWEHVSRLDVALRRHAFETVAFYHDSVPGFERARVMWMSAHVGARGSAGMVGECYLTFDDFANGARFDDVLFRNYVCRRQGRGHPDGADMPYRMLLPREVDGLLVAARGASFERRGHDSPPRPRCSIMMLGEAAGRAGAMAIAANVRPRDLDVRQFQRTLLSEGFFLGEPERLAELGLA